MQSFQYSATGYALTQGFEGLKLTSYQDQGGVWTIGYGHTGATITGGMVITLAQAQSLLESDVAGSVAAVNRLVTSEINQNQFDSLVDFVFNLGAAALLTSTLLRDVNAANFQSVPNEFLKWDHVKGVVIAGLYRRRQAEAVLFAS